jgi:putative restriction endonuclease
MSDAHGAALRLAAIDHLDRLLATGQETVAWSDLLRGFEFEGDRIPLISQRGIHRLKRLGPVPLSIATSPKNPYEDEVGEESGVFRYKYFQTDPDHPDNVGLRLACRNHVPLLYFHGLEPGVYVAFYPVLVVDDDPKALCVTVHVEERAMLRASPAAAVGEDRSLLREYVTRAAKRRLHQLEFRRRVVRAYARRCAMCNLRHVLDAAHILPDGHPRGDPVVPNGMALCRLHHAAFDANLIGVSPATKIVVRGDVLREEDGPVLEHGLKRLHGAALRIPVRSEWRPDPDRLAERFEAFKHAG